MSHISCSKVIPGNPQEVFAYACDVLHLRHLLHQYIEVDVDSASENSEVGAEYRLTMSRYGLSQKVRLRVTELKVGQSLTYRQIEGLFQKWVHTQKFEPHGEGHTLVTDLVEYEVPFGLIGKLLDDIIIRQDMSQVLESRLQVLEDVFLRRQQKRTEEEMADA